MYRADRPANAVSRALPQPLQPRRLWLAALLLLALAAALAVAPGAQSRTLDIQKVVSPGGIEAWLVQEAQIPAISLELMWRGGSALDPEGREGVAEMATGLLTEGAGDLDAAGFRRALDDKAVSIGFDAGRDYVSGQMRTLSANREAAFDLLRLTLAEPRFGEAEIAQARRQMLASLRRMEQDPESTASRTWFETAFAGQVYGKPPSGTVDSLGAIERADLLAFHRQRLARDNMIVAAVGDIDPETLGRLLDETFGGLPAKAAPFALPPQQVKAGGTRADVRMENPQTVILLGGPGIAREDPDYYAASVLNHILGGGGFDSRLMEVIREQRGLAYGAYSYMLPMADQGLFFAGTATANATAEEALSLLRVELARMRDEGPTAAELEGAKSALTGSFPLRMTSNRAIAGMLAGIQYRDLGMDFPDRYPAEIGAVDAAAVSRVAQRLLDQDGMLAVVVGDPLPAGSAPSGPLPGLEEGGRHGGGAALAPPAAGGG